MSQKRKQISFEQKLDILKRFKSGEKAVDIGRVLGLAPTTIRTICTRDADKIKEYTQTATSLQSKQVTKSRSSLMVKTESVLCEWIETQNQRLVPLNQMLIRNKAQVIFNDLKNDFPSTSRENLEQFEASRDWFSRFQARANLQNVGLKRRTPNANITAANNFKEELKSMIEECGYSSKQVFYVKETGLFWKRLPQGTYFSKYEESCLGFKSSRDRITIMLGGNAECDFKFKPFLLCRSENPKDVMKRELPIHWRTNKSARMTDTLFKDWLVNCAVPELKAYSSSQNIEFKILLLIDNAPGHQLLSDDFSENIKLVFMPPNATSIIQPMNQGIIYSFKINYTRRVLSQLFEAANEPNKPSMIGFWKNYNIVKAIENINQSWMDVRETCLNGIWRQLWSKCVQTDTQEVNDVPAICSELAESARKAGIDGMEEDDIIELLTSHEEEHSNESSTSIEQDDDDNTQAQAKHLKTSQIAEAIQLISKAMDIFAEYDSEKNRSSQVIQSMADAIHCYTEIYLGIKTV